ncbi:hypothetical protein E2C01_038722 [Portunus trituberculatus]|uniref:Uncharacterized protein n=1 Tax=Portunus trituberculatus TaxID=210409 RepID=A0A5B7FIQ6_PORTR|nr:hypothetical protein [Portunus trituberculatus]
MCVSTEGDKDMVRRGKVRSGHTKLTNSDKSDVVGGDMHDGRIELDLRGKELYQSTQRHSRAPASLLLPCHQTGSQAGIVGYTDSAPQ